MNLLPRCLFIFQELPVEISPNNSLNLIKISSNFFWQGEKNKQFNLKLYNSQKKEEARPYPISRICVWTQNDCAVWKDIKLSIINDPPIHAVFTHKNLGNLIDNLGFKPNEMDYRFKSWIQKV